MFFTSKELKIKDLKDIEQQKSKNFKNISAINAQLLDKNEYISKKNKIFNANNDLSNINLVTRLKTNFDLNNINKIDLVSKILATEVDKSQVGIKKKWKSNKSDTTK